MQYHYNNDNYYFKTDSLSDNVIKKSGYTTITDENGNKFSMTGLEQIDKPENVKFYSTLESVEFISKGFKEQMECLEQGAVFQSSDNIYVIIKTNFDKDINLDEVNLVLNAKQEQVTNYQSSSESVNVYDYCHSEYDYIV